MNRLSTTDEIDADDELLTAYLDQELTADERLQFEQRLVEEDGLRQRLAEMRRAWELLDAFPETPLNQQFTRSTIEMVALDIEQKREQSISLFGWKAAWLPKLSRRTFAATLAGMAILGGSILGLALRHRAIKNDAYQLAIASALPMLQVFPDVEMLQELRDTPNWKELLEVESIRDRILTDFPANDDVKTMQQWSNRLHVHQLELLYNQKQGLERMTPNERRKLEDRYEAIKSQSNAEEVRAVAAAFYGVLQSLPMNTRAEIRSLPNDRMSKALQQEACYKLALLHGENLTQEEKVHLDRWAHVDLVNQLRESPAIPIQFQESRLENLLLWTLFTPYSSSSQFNIESFAEPEELMESFYSGLTPETVRLFQGVAPKNQLTVIANWVLNKKPDSMKKPDDDEMYKRYESMNDGPKDRLDMLRPEEARRDLERMIGRSRRPGQDGPGPGGPGPGGPPPGTGGPFGPGTGGPFGPGPRPGGPFGPGDGSFRSLDRQPPPFPNPTSEAPAIAPE